MQYNSANINLKLTINQMLMSNLHIGHTRKFLNSNVKPYLLGTRNNINILNITKTPFQFKLFINILILEVEFLVQSNQLILVHLPTIWN